MEHLRDRLSVRYPSLALEAALALNLPLGFAVAAGTVAAAIVLVSVARAQTPPVFQRTQPGVLSSLAKYRWPGPTAVADFPLGGRNIVVVSPDGAIETRVTNIELTLVDRNKPTRFAQTSIPVASLAEIRWARGSDAFALTQSDGGWVGTWSVRLYRLGPTGLSESDPGRLVLADFKQLFPRCQDEYPNVAAVGWVEGPRRLRLVVEMPCHSSCTDMCRVAGYVVDTAGGGILERLRETTLRRARKAAIGSRLRP